MAPVSFRFAICNEIFIDTPLRDVCQQVRELGYEGLELAPHTLAEDATLLPERNRVAIRRYIEDSGLSFVGLHWLLASPPGLHTTTNDEGTRKRTWDYVHRAIDLCADLAGSRPNGNGVIVFGSPKQRSTTGGMTSRHATDLFTHGLAYSAPHAESRGVTLLVEALPISQSDVVNSLAEAAAIVKQIGSPAVQTMFDVHNAVDEKESGAELVRRYASHIRHVHVNEPDGSEPGMGNYDFALLLQALADVGYAGWVSVEAFDFSRDSKDIAKRAIDRLIASSPGKATAQQA
jgi:D-psicose/D-tagatose/L-ribulose 3-epimerase